MKRRLFIAALLLALGALQACNKDTGSINPNPTDKPAGKLIAASDCKSTATLVSNGVLSSGESAVEYAYDATKRTLTLKHINAAFNCCPGVLSATVSVEENLITIVEKESETSCNCNCLYDLDIEITNIARKSWRILFIEPYLAPPDLPLSFAIDLSTSSSGRHAVPRTGYP